jgi:hypothetical protein
MSGVRRLPRRRDDVEVDDKGAQAWLVVQATGAAHALNPTARAIWELCDGTVEIEEVVDAIRQLFDVPPGTVRSDVESVIEQFEAADLVTWSGVEGAPVRPS